MFILTNLSVHLELRDQSSSGDEYGCILQVLSAAVKLDSQWSVSCLNAVDIHPLWLATYLVCLTAWGRGNPWRILLQGLVVLTTWADWKRHQLYLSVHVVIQSEHCYLCAA